MNLKSLVDKIRRLTRERMVESDVVDFSALRKIPVKSVPKNVLVVEDDLTVRSSIERVLNQEGYRVMTAGCARELTEVLDDTPLDLILLDVGLPWINGFELAKMMKEHDDLKKIPLIFVSAQCDPDDLKKGFAVGADDFITKPFEIRELKNAVQTLLQLSVE